MKIVDKYGTLTEISLPEIGILRIGEELQDVNREELAIALNRFYGDRLSIAVDSVIAIPGNVAEEPTMPTGVQAESSEELPSRVLNGARRKRSTK